MRLIPTTVSLETMIEHSFRDYHVRGFDYLCLKRAPHHTVKAYFFDGDVSQLPEVVIPHDHRYPFLTCVAAGAVTNRTYTPSSADDPNAGLFDEFAYLTPLNGGDGFGWERETWLRGPLARVYGRGDSYDMAADQLHTIQIRRPETVLILHQFADVVAMDRPTRAFRPAGSRTPPSLDGLYSRMTPDHALGRLALLRSLLGAPD